MQNTTDFSCKLTDLSHAVHIPDLTSPTASVSVHKSHEIDITALLCTWDYVEQPPKPLLGSWPHEEPTGESWFWASVHSSQTHCLRKGQVRRSPISAQWHVMVSMRTPQPDIFCPALFSETYISCPPVVGYTNCSLWKCFSCLTDPYIEHTVRVCTVPNGSNDSEDVSDLVDTKQNHFQDGESWKIDSSQQPSTHSCFPASPVSPLTSNERK